MCHLTATGQTYFTSVTDEEYMEQALQVIDHWQNVDETGIAKFVHFNFMARGEPLANRYILKGHAMEILRNLATIAQKNGLEAKFKISTIMPTELRTIPTDIPLYWLFENNAQIYYSLYSVNERFRKRWLPKALPVPEALELLRSYQWDSPLQPKDPVLHWAFIEGENDSVEDVEATCQAILDSGVRGQFNLVRYNPPNNKSKESSPEVLERNFKIISEALDHPRSQIIPRVGFDVKASCGMFV